MTVGGMGKSRGFRDVEIWAVKGTSGGVGELGIWGHGI